MIWCTDYAAAIDRLRNEICNLLALTGVTPVAKLRPYWKQSALLVPYPKAGKSLFRWLNPTDSQRNGLFFSMKEKTRRNCWMSFIRCRTDKGKWGKRIFKGKGRSSTSLRAFQFMSVQRPPLPDRFTFVARHGRAS
ncbi:MAG: hypothetical protein V8T16_15780 [Parabacteroides merdae]